MSLTFLIVPSFILHGLQRTPFYPETYTGGLNSIRQSIWLVQRATSLGALSERFDSRAFSQHNLMIGSMGFEANKSKQVSFQVFNFQNSFGKGG